MRTTLETILAVEENQEVTHEELRLSLLALSSIDSFRSEQINYVIEAIELGKPTHLVRARIEFAKLQQETLFKALKTDPRVWIGESNLPESPEYQARRKIGKKIFEKATGKKL